METHLIRRGFFGRVGLLALLFLTSVSWSLAGTNTTNAPSFEELGEMYFHGKGVPKDLQKSFKNFRQAADMGSGSGQEGWGQTASRGGREIEEVDRRKGNRDFDFGFLKSGNRKAKKDLSVSASQQ